MPSAWWLLALVPLAFYAVPKEAWLPLKAQIAVNLLGWQGFFHVVRENVATRALGSLRSTQSRTAWHALLATLADVDLKYLTPERGLAQDDDVAEGHVYALHLLTTAAELFLHSDHIHPEFKFALSPWRKWWGDNPDVVYLHCLVHSDHTYVVRGYLGRESYLSLSVYATEKPGQYASRSVANLNTLDMALGPDGSFEVYVSKERPAHAGNWLKLDEGFMSVISRHYFEEAQPAALDRRVNVSISLVPESAPPSRPTDASVAQRLQWMETFVRDHSFDRPLFDPAQSPPWFSFTPNVIGTPAMHQQQYGGKTGGLGAVDIAYSAGPWKLEPHQALVIEGVLPSCRFANVVLWNRFLQTLDYAHRPVSLNRRQLRGLGADGSYTIVVAHQNPGAQYNWLDTEGRAGGTVFFRFVLPTSPLAAPLTRVVDFASLQSGGGGSGGGGSDGGGGDDEGTKKEQ